MATIQRNDRTRLSPNPSAMIAGRLTRVVRQERQPACSLRLCFCAVLFAVSGCRLADTAAVQRAIPGTAPVLLHSDPTTARMQSFCVNQEISDIASASAPTNRPATSRETARGVLERLAIQVLHQDGAPKLRVGGSAGLSKTHGSMTDVLTASTTASVDAAAPHRPALRRMESLDLAIPSRGKDGILK
eukprot:3393031-Rhodomonas_salina.1